MLKVLKTALLLSALLALPTQFAQSKELMKFVMGPLELVTDWNAFEAQLVAYKAIGVDGITTDVWWGIVETQEGHYDWSYYKKYADLVQKVGLKWVPIMSTHSARIGNVGDNVNIPIPHFAWSKGKDTHFVTATGEVNNEYLSIWNPESYKLYKKFMASFKENFAAYDSIIAKIYIGMGPSGELRFPSYGGEHWTYPSIGQLQASSESAKLSFQKYLQDKYKTIEALNTQWQAVFNTFAELGPPTDGLRFFEEGFKTQYGKDLLTWYQKALIDHLHKNTAVARAAFGDTFKAPLAVKVAGVSWKMSDPKYPHAAEFAAGYYKYDDLYRAIAHEKLEVTFTCLEQCNRNYAPEYSLPQDLAKQNIELAQKYGIPASAENAIAIKFSDGSDRQPVGANAEDVIARYQNIASGLDGLVAFVLLRGGDLVTSDGKLRPEAVLFQKYVTKKASVRDLNLNVPSVFEGCVTALKGLLEKPLSVSSSASKPI